MEKTADFDKILERKIAYYGHTKAAYQFACEEFSKIHQTGEDEFKAEYNSLEKLYEKLFGE